MSVNKIILLGRIGKDPETRTLPNGKITSFSIATSEKYTDKNGQKVENTEWHNVECWGKLADIAETYVKKGMEIYVEGKIKTDQWEKDGVKQYRTKVVAAVIQMIGGRQSEQSSIDDLPF